MENTIFSLAQTLLHVISPESSSVTDQGHLRYTVEEFRESEILKSLIEPGDIVITKTNSIAHRIVRKIMHSEYDHVAVFLSKNQVLHISPPRIRFVSSNIFLMQKLEPVILRPNLTDAEKQEFLFKLQNTKSDQYDYRGMMQVVGLKTINNVINLSGIQQNGSKENLIRKKICTDLIFYSLASCSTRFVECLRSNIEHLDFFKIGSFTPDDMKTLGIILNGKFFNIIYPQKALQIKKISNSSSNQQQSKVNQLMDELQLNNTKSKSTINQNFDNLIMQPKGEVFQVLEKVNSNNEYFQKFVQICEKFLFFLNFNNIIQQGLIKSAKKYSYASDIYISYIKVAYYSYKLKSLLKNKKSILNNKKAIIQNFGGLILAINSIMSYYKLEKTVKNVLQPNL